MSKKKASAPRPGAGRRAESAKAAQRVLRIRILDETRHLTPSTISTAVKAQVKAATRMSFEVAVGEDTFDDVSLAILWWVAGTTNGRLQPWRKAAAEWDELIAQVTDSDEDIEVVEVTADDEDLDDDPES